MDWCVTFFFLWSVVFCWYVSDLCGIGEIRSLSCGMFGMLWLFVECSSLFVVCCACSGYVVFFL